MENYYMIIAIVTLGSFIIGMMSYAWIDIAVGIKPYFMPTIYDLYFYVEVGGFWIRFFIIIFNIIWTILCFAYVIAVLMWTPVVKNERKRRANRL